MGGLSAASPVGWSPRCNPARRSASKRSRSHASRDVATDAVDVAASFGLAAMISSAVQRCTHLGRVTQTRRLNPLQAAAQPVMRRRPCGSGEVGSAARWPTGGFRRSSAKRRVSVVPMWFQFETKHPAPIEEMSRKLREPDPTRPRRRDLITRRSRLRTFPAIRRRRRQHHHRRRPKSPHQRALPVLTAPRSQRRTRRARLSHIICPTTRPRGVRSPYLALRQRLGLRADVRRHAIHASRQRTRRRTR